MIHVMTRYVTEQMSSCVLLSSVDTQKQCNICHC